MAEEFEKKIEEKVKRETKKFTISMILGSFFLWLLTISITYIRVPNISNEIVSSVIVDLMLLVAIAFLAVCCYALGTLAIKDRVEYQFKIEFVQKIFEKSLKKEIKRRFVLEEPFIFALEKRGKFFAIYSSEDEDKVKITYKFDGEDREILYETVHPKDLYDEYYFVEEACNTENDYFFVEDN